MGGCILSVCVFCVLRVLRYCGSVCPLTASSLMRATAAGFDLNVVDVYNGATGAWSTAQLSVANSNLAAASVGNVAFFAGGSNSGAVLCKKGGWGFFFFQCCLRVFLFVVLRYCSSVCPATVSSLMRATAGGTAYSVVDVYNVATGAWSTAQLSVARDGLAAASVGNVVLFAGGDTNSALLRWKGGDVGCIIVACVLFIVVFVFCVLRVLRVLRYCGSVCPATASSLMRATAGGTASNVVDVYNGATGAWSTAQLSVGRFFLAAASVGNVAFFAGGFAGPCNVVNL
jgi:hypothetical protein